MLAVTDQFCSLYDSTEAWIEPFLELTTYLVNLEDKKLPQVISISYGVTQSELQSLRLG